MRNACRHTLLLSVISALLLAPGFAVADNNVLYSGENPTGGMTVYSGNNSSDDYWDYVYDLSNVGHSGVPDLAQPDCWAIGVDYEPYAIFADDGDWVGQWDEQISTGEYSGYLDGSALIGRPGVVWTYTGHPMWTPPAGTFHFQSLFQPELRPWVVAGDGTAYDGAGSEWSANPEPASMALTGLALFGVGFWRRRKKTG